MKNITIAGYYGFGNFGDDIFVHTLVNSITKLSTHSKIQVISKPLQGLNTDFIVPPWFPDSIYRGKGQLGAIVRFLFFLKAILRADVLINGGGSVFEISGGLRMAKATRILKFFLGFKWYSVGISLPSNAAGSKDLINILKEMEYILVRDFKSMDILSESGFPAQKFSYGGDLAASDNELVCGLFPGNDVYDASICMSPHIDLDRAIQDFLSLVKSIEFPRLSVIVLNQEDYQYCLDFFNVLLEKKFSVDFIVYKNKSDIYRILKSSRLVITSRLHAAISSFLLQTSFYLYLHHEKCLDFIETTGMLSGEIKKEYCMGNVPLAFCPSVDSTFYKKISCSELAKFITQHLD